MSHGTGQYTDDEIRQLATLASGAYFDDQVAQGFEVPTGEVTPRQIRAVLWALDRLQPAPETKSCDCPMCWYDGKQATERG